MIKLLIFLVIYNQILSDPKFILSVQEKIRPNAEVGDLFPLIVKPTVDVAEETEIVCNGNIRYRTRDDYNPDLDDVSPKTKISVGTKAGTIIKFNCVVVDEIKDITVNIELGQSMTDWSVDENNKQIRFTANYEAEKAKSSADKGEEDKNDSRNIKILWKFMMILLILLF